MKVQIGMGVLGYEEWRHGWSDWRMWNGRRSCRTGYHNACILMSSPRPLAQQSSPFEGASSTLNKKQSKKPWKNENIVKTEYESSSMPWIVKELWTSEIQRKRGHGFDTSSYGKVQSIKYFQEELKTPKINPETEQACPESHKTNEWPITSTPISK